MIGVLSNIWITQAEALRWGRYVPLRQTGGGGDSVPASPAEYGALAMAEVRAGSAGRLLLLRGLLDALDAQLPAAVHLASPFAPRHHHQQQRSKAASHVAEPEAERRQADAEDEQAEAEAEQAEKDAAAEQTADEYYFEEAEGADAPAFDSEAGLWLFVAAGSPLPQLAGLTRVEEGLWLAARYGPPPLERDDPAAAAPLVAPSLTTEPLPSPPPPPARALRTSPRADDIDAPPAAPAPPAVADDAPPAAPPPPPMLADALPPLPATTANPTPAQPTPASALPASAAPAAPAASAPEAAVVRLPAPPAMRSPQCVSRHLCRALSNLLERRLMAGAGAAGPLVRVGEWLVPAVPRGAVVRVDFVLIAERVCVRARVARRPLLMPAQPAPPASGALVVAGRSAVRGTLLAPADAAALHEELAGDSDSDSGSDLESASASEKRRRRQLRRQEQWRTLVGRWLRPLPPPVAFVHVQVGGAVLPLPATLVLPVRAPPRRLAPADWSASLQRGLAHALLLPPDPPSAASQQPPAAAPAVPDVDEAGAPPPPSPPAAAGDASMADVAAVPPPRSRAALPRAQQQYACPVTYRPLPGATQLLARMLSRLRQTAPVARAEGEVEAMASAYQPLIDLSAGFAGAASSPKRAGAGPTGVAVPEAKRARRLRARAEQQRGGWRRAAEVLMGGRTAAAEDEHASQDDFEPIPAAAGDLLLLPHASALFPPASSASASHSPSMLRHQPRGRGTRGGLAAAPVAGRAPTDAHVDALLQHALSGLDLRALLPHDADDPADAAPDARDDLAQISAWALNAPSPAAAGLADAEVAAGVELELLHALSPALADLFAGVGGGPVAGPLPAAALAALAPAPPLHHGTPSPAAHALSPASPAGHQLQPAGSVPGTPLSPAHAPVPPPLPLPAPVGSAGASGGLELLEPPAALVGFEDDWAEVPLPALASWEKALLEPLAPRKDLLYWVVLPADERLHELARAFFRDVAAAYDAARLGSLAPAPATGASGGSGAADSGAYVLVPRGADAGDDVASAYAAHLLEYQQALKRVAKAVVDAAAALADCAQVVFVLSGHEEATRAAELLQLASEVPRVCAPAAHAAVHVQLVRTADLLAPPPSLARELAFLTFAKSRRVSLPAAAAASASGQAGRLYEPLYVLAPPHAPSAPLSAPPPPQLRTLHVGYARSGDGLWHACVLADERGELLEPAALRIPSAGGSDAYVQMWLHVVRFLTVLSASATPCAWRVVICKAGALFSAAELRAWREAVREPDADLAAHVSAVTLAACAPAPHVRLVAPLAPAPADTPEPVAVPGSTCLLQPRHPMLDLASGCAPPQAAAYLLPPPSAPSTARAARAPLAVCVYWTWSEAVAGLTDGDAARAEAGELARQLQRLAFVVTGPRATAAAGALAVHLVVARRLARLLPLLRCTTTLSIA